MQPGASCPRRASRSPRAPPQPVVPARARAARPAAQPLAGIRAAVAGSPRPRPGHPHRHRQATLHPRPRPVSPGPPYASAYNGVAVKAPQQGNEPEHDRRGGSHSTGHGAEHSPGERVHAVTIRNTTSRTPDDLQITSSRQLACPADSNPDARRQTSATGGTASRLRAAP